MVVAEGQARREKQTAYDAIIIYSIKIAKLRDHLAGLVDNDDVVFLIGADPEIVLAIDCNPVGSVRFR